MGAQGGDAGSAAALIDDTQPLLKQVGGGALLFSSPLALRALWAIDRAATMQDASADLIRWASPPLPPPPPLLTCRPLHDSVLWRSWATSMRQATRPG